MLHRFKTGQMLELRASPRQSIRPSGPCEVISCLPHEGGPLLYRVRSQREIIDRVVDEFDLSPSSASKTDFAEAESAFSVAIKR
ncbi:hypothetical protein SAMN05216456_3527 [Devosia crocina]|uniref:Uncharacterized protein n=1 Tax=Devosia crocina TaxID=429728 RepID=A0A1I7NVC5_9HYPH|nr:hypothetical protein SAMN05216456_3527 [Devosia crocina]